MGETMASPWQPCPISIHVLLPDDDPE